MNVRRAGAIVACAFLSTPAFAQPSTPTKHVTGIVVDAQTSTPVRRARVDAGITTTTWVASFTDDQGAFAMDVPRTAAELRITKAGFALESVKIPGGEGEPLRVSMNRAAAITGHLIDASGTPLVNVNVSVRGAAVRNASTNDLGEFRFGGLPAGEFTINYPVPMNPVRVRAGDTMDVGDVVYELTPVVATTAAERVADPRRRPAVTGNLWDEYGEPIQGAFVRVLQVTRVDDRLAALPVGGVSGQLSDDRGVYRVFGLRPGRYLVAADVQGYADTYYPGGTNVTYATPIVIDRADAAGLDITCRPERTVRVAGTAVTSAGQPAVGPVLLAVSHRSGAIVTQPKAALLAPDGSFEFEHIPPGEYVIQVSAPIDGLRPKVEEGKLMVPRTEFGMQRLTITDAEPPPLLLRTSPGATLRGKISAEGAALPPRLVVFPYPTDFDQSFAIGSGPQGWTADADGSFIVTGVTGPRRFRIASPLDWYVKEARVGSIDALDASFDFGLEAKDVDDIQIVVSPLGAAVTGRVVAAGGDAVADSAVLLFSTESSKWSRFSQSLRMVKASLAGDFRVGGLPPGSYFLLAVGGESDLITSGDWQDPATLEKLGARATRITLGEGEQRTFALRVQ